MLITIVQYAEKHGFNRSSVSRMAQNGLFNTAVKIGRCWYVDSDEPFPSEHRTTSGKYVDWRKKYPSRSTDSE